MDMVIIDSLVTGHYPIQNVHVIILMKGNAHLTDGRRAWMRGETFTPQTLHYFKKPCTLFSNCKNFLKWACKYIFKSSASHMNAGLRFSHL